MEISKLRDSIKILLSDKRYLHSLGVEAVCYDLALIHGEDTIKANTAGILHDCAKYMPDDETIKECVRYNLAISDTERMLPSLLHGKLGAVYAREKYGVKDEAILNAIRYHTTGRPAMSKLEKIVYVADYIEPNRKPIPELDKVREIAYLDLDKAVICISELILEYLKEKDTIIDLTTKETYDYYVNQLKLQSKKTK